MRNTSIVLPTILLSLKNFLVFSILFYLPLYFSNMGFSGLQIGVLLSTFAVTSFASSFLAGLLSDRFPVRYLSALSFFLLIVYLISFSLTENFWIILASFFIGGLGNNVADIGDRAFAYCSNLRSVTIPDSVAAIGRNAFHYCTNLTSISIGNSVTTIEDYAFSECSSLSSLTIGSSVAFIGDYAFGQCTSLTNIIPTTIIPRRIYARPIIACIYCAVIAIRAVIILSTFSLNVVGDLSSPVQINGTTVFLVSCDISHSGKNS